MTEKDRALVSSNEVADVQTYTQAEVDAMVRAATEGNPGPAYEEGPHLQDPEVRAAKKQQMLDAGLTLDDDDLTDDMRAILEEDD